METAGATKNNENNNPTEPWTNDIKARPMRLADLPHEPSSDHSTPITLIGGLDRCVEGDTPIAEGGELDTVDEISAIMNDIRKMCERVRKTCEQQDEANVSDGVDLIELGGDNVQRIFNIEDDAIVADQDLLLQVLKPERSFAGTTTALLSDGKYTIKCHIVTNRSVFFGDDEVADSIEDKCVIQVTNYRAFTNKDGTKSIFIREYNVVALSDEVGDPVKINRSKKWASIIELSGMIPFVDMELVKSQRNIDMNEPNSWKQKSFLELDTWIEDLAAIHNEMSRRHADLDKHTTCSKQKSYADFSNPILVHLYQH